MQRDGRKQEVGKKVVVREIEAVLRQRCTCTLMSGLGLGDARQSGGSRGVGKLRSLTRSKGRGSDEGFCLELC